MHMIKHNLQKVCTYFNLIRSYRYRDPYIDSWLLCKLIFKVTEINNIIIENKIILVEKFKDAKLQLIVYIS